MNISTISTILFALALIHTFLASHVMHYSHKFPENSTRRAVLHLVGEVEIIFGFWAAIFMAFMAFYEAPHVAVDYIEGLHFTEPIFVFVIMVVCATRPILVMARELMSMFSWFFTKTFRIPAIQADVLVLLGIGPLLGSFITEPAAMTVVALLLRSMVETVKSITLYALLAVLFVNISIGGSLTSFAAPPILMVAQTWGWDLQFVLTNFGIKSAIAVLVNSIVFTFAFWKDLGAGVKPLSVVSREHQGASGNVPLWIKGVHLLFLVLIIMTHTHSNVFMGLFLFFLGITAATKRFQDSLRLREALLVAFFLGGLMVFGAFQKWWLQPLLASLSEAALFLGATGLTAITDNAALTYLGSQVEGLSDASKYALVAGALAGGGLTVLANAPNPAGYSILVNKFPDGAINHLKFFFIAIPPTLVALGCLWPW